MEDFCHDEPPIYGHSSGDNGDFHGDFHGDYFMVICGD